MNHMTHKNQKSRIGYIHRLSLYHLTDKSIAEKIINSQTFLLSNKGLYGAGVYFGNTLEACIYKTKHHPGILKNMTLLVADVYVGNFIKITKREATTNKVDTNGLKNKGFNAILGYKMKTGREFICLDASRIHNIKYASGLKPNVNFKINWHRVTLFKYVSKIEAITIHGNQSFFKEFGPFGKGYYLFDSMSDAKNNNKKGETYLACDAEIKPTYILKRNQTLQSNNIYHKGYKCFIGTHNNCSYYIFTDLRMIKKIHYCGGKPWN